MAAVENILLLTGSLRQFHKHKLVLNNSPRGLLPCIEWVPFGLYAFANMPSSCFFQFALGAVCVTSARLLKRGICVNIGEHTLAEIDKLEDIGKFATDPFQHLVAYEKLRRMDLKRHYYQRFLM